MVCEVPVLIMAVSSANRHNWVWHFLGLGISLTNMLNNKGPTLDPCTIPALITRSEERLLLTRTEKSLPRRYVEMSLMMLPGIPIHQTL
ncbi:hypothetical protein AVEN_11330-1 [Araneus ventricosus]|uniref:Uncharacterized protein n=1 Tax=Araneus ventricosus TaxID=182803 RepID=A0A4Y2PCN0_ARAVE|nr:hypothetical protein AVEN_11330-1 [Araneus ventricosus]